MEHNYSKMVVLNAPSAMPPGKYGKSLLGRLKQTTPHPILCHLILTVVTNKWLAINQAIFLTVFCCSASRKIALIVSLILPHQAAFLFWGWFTRF